MAVILIIIAVVALVILSMLDPWPIDDVEERRS